MYHCVNKQEDASCSAQQNLRMLLPVPRLWIQLTPYDCPYHHIFLMASPTQPLTSTPSTLLPSHRPAPPLLSQAWSVIDTEEGMEKTHAKKAPLPLSLLLSDNDRLSSHSDQHCHPQHCGAQTTHTYATAGMRILYNTNTHTYRTYGCENPHQPRQHWQPSHCCHFSYFYTGAWQHIKNPSRSGNNMRPLHQAH